MRPNESRKPESLPDSAVGPGPATRPADPVRAFAAGDFDALSLRFARAGLRVLRPQPGILRLESGYPGRARLLLSAGVHGDETAPIEILAALMDELAAAPDARMPDLLLVLGNPDAVAAGARYLDADMNRMFRAARGEPGATREARRAEAVMQACVDFFDAAADRQPRWHLDLHTAIRSSRHPGFAVVPSGGAESGRARLLAWLAQAGIEAAILNPDSSSGTFSAWSAQQCGTVGATVELGRIGPLGQNDLAPFARTVAALRALLHGAGLPPPGGAPRLYRVVRELRKHSAAFHAHFAPDTENFAPFAAGTLIAEDGALAYRAGNETEYIVFPNPDVQIGLRAGLMVVPA